MAKQQLLDDQIRALLAQGESRETIARELGVTEWRVRCVIRSEATRLVIRRGTKEVRLHTVTAEQGDVADPSPAWTDDPDWQQGFVTLEWTRETAAARLHAISEGRMVCDGVVYEARTTEGKSST